MESQPKALMARYRIPGTTLAVMASRRNATVWPSDVSTWAAGRPVAADKAERLNEALDAIVDVLTAPNSEFPNLADPASVKSAIEKLATLREIEERAASGYFSRISAR